MSLSQTKLERRFHLIFIAITIPVLMVDDAEKIYMDESMCKSYRNHILMLSVFYHIIITMISVTNKDWTTIYLLIFCLTFGIFQTFIADNYLCSNNMMHYPLNKYPISNILGYCIPEYMIFSWSMFAFLEIKMSQWLNTFYNSNKKIISVIISSIFGYILIISMEIVTNLPEIKMIALWKANDKHPKVYLFIGGLASYLIIPELCLCIALAFIYHYQYRNVLCIALVTIIYYLVIII